MANNKECAVCREMMEKKHKYDKFYKIAFFIVLAIAVIFIGLYFSSGDVFKKTNNITNSNEENVDIDGSDNNNVIIKNGCYIIPQSK